MEENKNYISLEDLTKMGNENYVKFIKENKVKDILRAIGLFPDQTITNDVLILTQKPEATCVKRMKEWNYYKRSVKKNEKAIKVVTHFLEKAEKEFKDSNGDVVTKQEEVLKSNLGYVFDISQTEGKEYEYLNSNKENIAKHFDVAKSALERTAKGYEFKYENIDETSKVDFENKKIYVKDGLTIDEVIKTLIKEVTNVLLKSRYDEGINRDKNPNIDEIEFNSALYAIHTKLGLEEPEYNFDSISEFSDDDIVLFKENLQKVRSVTKQLLSNFESSIEKAVRNLEKETEEKTSNKEEKTEPAIEEKPKKTRTRKKVAESEVENA